MQIIKGLSFPLQFTARGNLKTSEKAQKLIDNLKTIVTTAVNSRTMRPTFGVPTEDLLFGKMQNESTLEVRDDIIEAISLYEPRVKLTRVDVVANFEKSSFDITISFRIDALGYQPVNTFKFNI